MGDSPMSDLLAPRIIFEYAKAWSLLSQNGAAPEQHKIIQGGIVALDHGKLLSQIAELKYRLRLAGQAGEQFGKLARADLSVLLESLEAQDHRGYPVYPNIALRAANLLYCIIKERPFVDGNKRIAAFLFLLYLHLNERLLLSRVSIKFPPTAIVPLCLLVENSADGQRDYIVRSIESVIELNPLDLSIL